VHDDSKEDSRDPFLPRHGAPGLNGKQRIDPSALPPHIRAMLEPNFYPHATHDIELLQTHISWVILTGPYAYKLKKPVNFGFLDFTTIEQRRHYCEEELRLNRRTSPELYLKVIPVGETAGDFHLGTNGHITDYCLKMVQFSQGDLLSARLEADRFDPAWMDMLAHDIAAFHKAAETGPEIRAFGDRHYIREHIEANLEVAEQHPDTPQIDTIRAHTEALFDGHSAHFAERQRRGHIRACHGDLHLRNIALYDERPHLFDCIEFSDELRMIDTISDVAFLVMDCDARLRPDLGFRFLSRYLEATGDYEGLMLLPFYLSYRASVRGKVAYLLADAQDTDEALRREQLSEARRYFVLAGEYSRDRNPTLFVVGGLSGSGKSHLALQGCGIERAITIRSDATRKRLAESRPDLSLYGDELDAMTYAAMFDAARQVIHAGFSAIMDATFLRREDRDTARGLAGSLDVPLKILWLEIPPDLLRRRIRTRTKQGRDVSDADLEVLEMQLADYRRPDEDDILFLESSAAWPRTDW